MNRAEALNLLRELAHQGLVDPSFMAINLRCAGRYEIQIRNEYRRDEIAEFAKNNKLCVDEDKEKGYLRIYKP